MASSSSSSSASSSSLFLRREKPAVFYSISKDATKPKPLLQELFLYIRGLFGIVLGDQHDSTEHGCIVRVSSHQNATNVVEMAIADSVSNSVTIASFNNRTGALEEESLLQSSTLANLQTMSSSSIGQKKPIFCINWLRYTETLLLGTKGGVIRYNMKSDDNYTRGFYGHPLCKDVHDIVSSPLGRYFCFASKGDRQLMVCDQLIAGGISNVPCMRGSTYLPGTLSWSTGGHMVIFATEANEVILVDTMFWKHQSCGQLISMKIRSICWLDETSCMFASNFPSCDSHPTVSTINFEIGVDGAEMTSFTPSNLRVDMNVVFGMVGNGYDDFDSTDYGVDRMIADYHGKFLAMSFCDKNNDLNKLPYIVVFLFQTIPFIALTPFTYLSSSAPRRPIRYNNDEDAMSTARTFPLPQSMEFLRTKVDAPTKIVVCYSHSDNNTEDITGNDTETIEVVVTEINPKPAYRK